MIMIFARLPRLLLAFSTLLVLSLAAAHAQSLKTAATVPFRDPAKQFGKLVHYPLTVVPDAAAVGDFNGDGFVDVVVAGYSSTASTVSISAQLGRGDGTFYIGPTVASTSTGVPFSLTAADLNGDGKLDLVLAVDNGGPPNGSEIVFLGNGDGTFTQGQSYTGGGLGSVVGDFNADGFLDLAATQIGGGGVDLWLGNGDGTFRQISSIVLCGVNIGCVGGNPLVGDFNGDGRLDLIIQCQDGNGGCVTFSGGFSLALGNGDGTFQTPVFQALGNDVTSAVVGDFNNDGKLDIGYLGEHVYCSSFYPGNVGVALGNGDGTFQAATYQSASGRSCIGNLPIVADFNGDGNLDFADAYSLQMFLSSGPGTFERPEILGRQAATSGFAADLNGDGAPDMLLLIQYPNSNLATALNLSGDLNTLNSGTNPSIVGQPVTFTSLVRASVANPIVPTGTVTFADGTVTLGTTTLSTTGVATFTTSSLTAGNHSIHATYSGDATYIPKSAGLVQSVNP